MHIIDISTQVDVIATPCRLRSRSRRADDSLTLDSRCAAFVAVMNTNAQWVHTQWVHQLTIQNS